MAEMTFEEASGLLADFYIGVTEKGIAFIKLFLDEDEDDRLFMAVMIFSERTGVELNISNPQEDFDGFFKLIAKGEFGEREQYFQGKRGEIHRMMKIKRRIDEGAHISMLPSHVKDLIGRFRKAAAEEGMLSETAACLLSELRKIYPINVDFGGRRDVETREGLYTALLKDLREKARNARGENGNKNTGIQCSKSL